MLLKDGPKLIRIIQVLLGSGNWVASVLVISIRILCSMYRMVCFFHNNYRFAFKINFKNNHPYKTYYITYYINWYSVLKSNEYIDQLVYI